MEELNVKRDGMTFGEAIACAKAGKLIARNGWNGKGMFVFLRPADTIESDMISKIKSLPNAVKFHYQDRRDRGLQFSVQFGEYFCMRDAQGHIVNGWLASQTDMLANDWEEVIVP